MNNAYTGVVGQLLNQHNLHPVIIDIGASGPPRRTWEPISNQSIFVGFDPDLRQIYELTDTGFYRAVMVNEAVTAQNKSEIPFFLTRSPYCSSTLEPDMRALSQYSFADLFHVEREVMVKATTLDVVLRRLGLERVDWFKTDSQGTDLALFNSLPENIREGVFCVEVEPGLIDAYKREDLFVDVHRDLIRQGFWLSDAKLCGTARIRQTTIQHLRQMRSEFDAEAAQTRCRMTPSWVEATYLRSIDHLLQRHAPGIDYVLLWTCALIGRQWGFALDVALAYQAKFGSDDTGKAMFDSVATWMIKPVGALGILSRFVKNAKSRVPFGVKQWIKNSLK